MKTCVYDRPSIKEAYKMYFKYTYMFESRSRRAEYVPILIGNTIFYLIEGFIAIFLGITEIFNEIHAILLGLLALIITVPWPALMIRRMHDFDHSAVRLLIFLLPAVGWTVYFGYLIYLCFRDSNDYYNDWGDSPKYYDVYE